MTPWRLITESGVSASFGLAADEYLLGSVARGGVPALRLYTYRSHVALVGRFQNIEAELRLHECRRIGAEISRRPTGGGAIIMGEDQLGLALVIPPDGDHADASPADLFPRYAAPVIDALRTFGVEAAFRPKNDVEVAGKKIAGLGVYIDDDGTLLFHASTLVDLDVRLMLSLLNITQEKISDKHIATFEERLTTVRRAAGRAVAVDDVRAAVAASFERAFGLTLEPQPFTGVELRAIGELEAERYANAEWIFARTPPPDATGASIRKTDAGLLRVYVALAGDVIKSALITGDFFGDNRALPDLEARLKWSEASPAAIAAAVAAASVDPATAPVWNLDPELLAGAIVAAVEDARSRAGAGRTAAGV
ncbi:MAG: lipoate--protein ligase family protein [Dehalococcoidia bacterium]|nr:MAG: lipoate--protein ligase family protein [Dehalococcoidia bacterium]